MPHTSPTAICSACLARATDAEFQYAALATIMRPLLDVAGLRRHQKMSDEQVATDTSRYFTKPRQQATRVLQALGKLARPAPAEPPF